VCDKVPEFPRRKTGLNDPKGKKAGTKGKDRRKACKEKPRGIRGQRAKDRATQNLEALFVGLSVLPCPGLPEGVDCKLDDSLSDGAELAAAVRLQSSAEVTPHGSPGGMPHQGEAHEFGVMKQRLSELRAQMQAIQDNVSEASAGRTLYLRCQALWTLWSSAEVLLVDAQKGSCQGDMSQNDHRVVVLDVIHIGHQGASTLRTMVCNEERTSTADDVLPLYRWVEESLRGFQRFVEFMVIHASQVYDVVDETDAAELETAAAGLCRALYELCRDVIWHIFCMGDIDSNPFLKASLDGLVLIEGLAYKVVAFVLDMMNGDASKHWSLCWNMDGGDLLFQIEAACSRSLSLIGLNEELAADEVPQLSESMYHFDDKQVSTAPWSLTEQSSMSSSGASFPTTRNASDLSLLSMQFSSDGDTADDSFDAGPEHAPGWFFNCLSADSSLLQSLPDEDVSGSLQQDLDINLQYYSSSPSQICYTILESSAEAAEVEFEEALDRDWCDQHTHLDAPVMSSEGMHAAPEATTSSRVSEQSNSNVLRMGQSLSVEIMQVSTLNDSDLNIIRSLGRGSFGLVFLAKSSTDQAKTALKIIKDIKRGPDGRPTPAEMWESFKREWETCRKLRHKNIVKFHRVIWFITSSKESPRLNPGVPHLCIEMEHCGPGDLEGLLERAAKNLQPRCEHQILPIESLRKSQKKAIQLLTSWENRFDVACQVALALEYMHMHEVVHRDLRPTNILLCLDSHTIDGSNEHKLKAKVCDFGACRILKNQHSKPFNDDVVSPKYQVFKSEIPSHCDLFVTPFQYLCAFTINTAALPSIPIHLTCNRVL